MGIPVCSVLSVADEFLFIILLSCLFRVFIFVCVAVAPVIFLSSVFCSRLMFLFVSVSCHIFHYFDVKLLKYL